VPKAEPRNVPIRVGTETIEPGRSRTFDLRVARLPTGTWLSLPVRVVNGRYPGPNLWLSGAVHGDEINGVEIVRRLVPRIQARSLRGAVIAVPIVNLFGFVGETRYMPDRRDLNRSFPGSPRGSLASRLAHLFMTEVVEHCDVGIDFHTATGHRVNLPQIRADLDDPDTRRLAEAFGAPFVINARLRDGSLRASATRAGRTVLLYEAGQAHRFDDSAIDTGVDGVLRVMEALEMGSWEVPKARRPVEVTKTTWVRARRGGIADLEVRLGDRVERGDVVAVIGDALGSRPTRVKAPASGWVIAATQNPLVSPGDALVHLAVPDVAGRDEPAERRRR
jgi:uncharacterized protein